MRAELHSEPDAVTEVSVRMEISEARALLQHHMLDCQFAVAETMRQAIESVIESYEADRRRSEWVERAAAAFGMNPFGHDSLREMYDLALQLNDVEAGT